MLKGSRGVVRVNQPLGREDTRLYTLVSSHMKSSLKGTLREESTGVVRVNQPMGMDIEDTRLYTLVSFLNTVRKKVSHFPVPAAGMPLTKLFPARESLVSGIPTWDWKKPNLFFTVYLKSSLKGTLAEN